MASLVNKLLGMLLALDVHYSGFMLNPRVWHQTMESSLTRRCHFLRLAWVMVTFFGSLLRAELFDAGLAVAQNGADGMTPRQQLAWRARLEVGWARPDTPRVQQQFETVLREYEALDDMCRQTTAREGRTG